MVLVMFSPARLRSRMDFTIDPVTSKDIPALLELIRELARFEQLEHEVIATPKTLRESMFGAQPTAGALLARVNGELAGYAVYFFTFSTFVGRPGIWLEDVYVRPAHRRHSLGRALLEAVARVGVRRGCGRFEWTALHWNKHALDWYRKLGARTMDEWVLLRLDAAGLRRVAGASTHKTTAGPIDSLPRSRPRSRKSVVSLAAAGRPRSNSR